MTKMVGYQRFEDTGAAHAYIVSLLFGENPTLGVLEVINGASDYETVAASQADQVMGSTGAAEDYLDTLLVTVGAAATLTVKDGATTVFTFAFGAAVATPIEIPIKAKSLLGAWKITTGASMTVLAKGRFS